MVSENPDTTILLTNGKHLIVRETMDEVVEKIREERRNIVRELLGSRPLLKEAERNKKRKGYNRLWTFCRLLV